MPAEPERTVLARIPDVEDREMHVCILTWPGQPEFGTQMAIEDYIPSRGIYGQGYWFDPRHLGKVTSALDKGVTKVGAALAAAARDSS